MKKEYGLWDSSNKCIDARYDLERVKIEHKIEKEKRKFERSQNKIYQININTVIIICTIICIVSFLAGYWYG